MLRVAIKASSPPECGHVWSWVVVAAPATAVVVAGGVVAVVGGGLP